MSEYVARIMKEKNLKVIDVQRRSGGKIADSYVTNIVEGTAKNPTIDKLQALAAGLDVDLVELFKIAVGIAPDSDEWTAEELARATQRMVRLKPNEIRQVKKILKME